MFHIEDKQLDLIFCQLIFDESIQAIQVCKLGLLMDHRFDY